MTTLTRHLRQRLIDALRDDDTMDQSLQITDALWRVEDGTPLVEDLTDVDEATASPIELITLAVDYYGIDDDEAWTVADRDDDRGVEAFRDDERRPTPRWLQRDNSFVRGR